MLNEEDLWELEVNFLKKYEKSQDELFGMKSLFFILKESYEEALEKIERLDWLETKDDLKKLENKFDEWERKDD